VEKWRSGKVGKWGREEKKRKVGLKGRLGVGRKLRLRD